MSDQATIRAEKPRKRGYRRLAAAMAWAPSLAIFPRFREANALNLLCLQAEVTALEEKLNDAIDRDHVAQTGKVEEEKWSHNFEILREQGEDGEQWQLYLELRAKLKEYNDALLQQIALNNQIQPNDYDYERLQEWLNNPAGGNRELRGAGSKDLLPFDLPLGARGRLQHDLVMAAPNASRDDVLARWASKILARFGRHLSFFRFRERDFLPEEPDGMFFYIGVDGSVRSAGDRITSVLAGMLILVPVIILTFLQNPSDRLIVVVVSSFSFIMAMATLTAASRSELFGAAAAFIAVQVVYIGSAVQAGPGPGAN